MTNTTPTTRDEARAIRREAARRSTRTLLQGAAVTALAAGAMGAATVIQAWTGADLLSGESWATVGTAGGTAALIALASWVHANIRPPV